MTSEKTAPGKSGKDVKNTSGGGHVGGTHLGQEPDAKDSSGRDDKGDKARPNDGTN
jgi:hypothetical protein